MLNYRIFICIPTSEKSEETESNQELELLISKQILEYLKARLYSENKVTVRYSYDLVSAYKDACESEYDLFVTCNVKLSVHPISKLLIQYFTERTETSMVLGQIVTNKMNRLEFFDKNVTKELPSVSEKPITNLILGLLLGSNTMSIYNTDLDSFVIKIVESIIDAINDITDNETDSIDYSEFSDQGGFLNE